MIEIPISRSESNRKLTLAERAAMRASSGLYFLENHLLRSQGGTDAAYSRSRYILLSYNFELILKSWLILVSSFQEEGQIIERLKTHNLEKLFKMRPEDTLLDIQIENITKGELNGFTEYHTTLVVAKKLPCKILLMFDMISTKIHSAHLIVTKLKE